MEVEPKDYPRIFLATIDVNSLFTQIDHVEGAQAHFEKLEQRKNKSFLSVTLKERILVVLRYVLRFGWGISILH